MRLLHLYLGDYRVLNDLRIEFDILGRGRQRDRSYNLDFLVGVNGSGKSTVLRALAEIFQGLSGEKQVVDFPFSIEYWLDEPKNIRIYARNTHPETGDLLDGFLVTRADSLEGNYPDFDLNTLQDTLEREALPDRIIAYTTGDEWDWKTSDSQASLNAGSLEVLEKFTVEELALRELPTGRRIPTSEEKPANTFFRLIRNEEMPIVALCGFLVNSAATDEKSRPLNHVFNEAKIKKVTGFSLRLDISAATYVQRQELHNRLVKYAKRSIRSGSEVRLVFSLDDFTSIFMNEFGGGLELYEFLSGLSARGEHKIPVLSSVSLFVERQPVNGHISPLHTWEWLSDGERCFLGRMCLFLLFGETDALIMLDEPEVHFNDYWKRHIVGLLHNILTQNTTTHMHNCHLLIATHSSIALTDVHRDDIILLVREDLKTSGKSHTPNFQTFGADPSDIMVHVFGTKFASGERSVSYIREQIGKLNKDQLVDFQKEVAPGYWHYRIQLEIDQFGEMRVQ